MKKKYINPTIRLHNVIATDVITTSDKIGFGDEVGETSTDAPRRGGDWSDYNQW